MKKKLLIIFFGLIFGLLFYRFAILKPSQNRNWEVGLEKLSKISIENNLIKIENLRDYKYDVGQITSFDYLNRTVNIDEIEKVWFVLEPFTKFDGVAHTYFVFDFKNEEPIIISVEARREKGEDFSAFLGTFNKFELIYLWGTEKDLTLRRILVEDSKVYMYPLNISQNGSKQLFLQLATTTQSLENQPRFYNTLTSNCTNELAKAANKVKKNAIPFNLALFMPGYSDELLYKLGYIPNNIPFKEVTKKYYISDIAKELSNEESFSEKLRLRLGSDTF